MLRRGATGDDRFFLFEHFDTATRFHLTVRWHAPRYDTVCIVTSDLGDIGHLVKTLGVAVHIIEC